MVHISLDLFSILDYRKYFEKAARINKFMKISQKIFGVDMKKMRLMWDRGNMMSNKIGLLHSDKTWSYCFGEGKLLAVEGNSTKRIKITQRTEL